MKEEIVIEIQPIDEDTCGEECPFHDEYSYNYPYCVLFQVKLNYLSHKDFDNDTCMRSIDCRNCKKNK